MDQALPVIVEKEFGQSPVSVEEILGRGQVNLVYKVTLKDGSYVLRMKKGVGVFGIYEKEKWCMEQVRQIGVPTPEPFMVGVKEDAAYFFQEYIPGVNGKDAPEAYDRIWHTLGVYARKVNTIPAQQYQRDFDELDKKLFQSNFFVLNNILSNDKVQMLRARLRQTRSWNNAHMLCHANLNPTNTVVHPSGAIYLIDWGTASGNRAPHEELADLFAWNTGKENIDIFLKGYGLSKMELDGMMHDIQTLVLGRMLNVMHYRVTNGSSGRDPNFVSTLLEQLNNITDFDAKILFSKNV